MTNIAQEPVSSLAGNNISFPTGHATQLISKPVPSISTIDLLKQLSPLPESKKYLKKCLITRLRKMQKMQNFKIIIQE